MSREAKKQVSIRPLSAVGENDELLETESKISAATTSRNNTDQQKFDILCDGVINSLSEVQATLQELYQLKDSLLQCFLPAPLLFKVAVIFGKVFRAFSDMNTPVNELIRLVRIYSQPWDQNSVALRRLYSLYDAKKQMLNIAIKRLASIDKRTALFEKDKRIANWEKLFIKLNEAKGHGRRWKFRIDTFRKHANEGYDELIKWVKSEPNTQSSIDFKKTLNEKKSQERTNKKHSDLSGNFVSQSHRTLISEDDIDREAMESVVEMESDDESFLTKSSANRYQKKPDSPQVLIEKAEATTQTQIDTDEKNIWTGEPEYTRYFILRLFKPTGVNAVKLKCFIQIGDKICVSKQLEPPKPEKKVKIIDAKLDQKKKPGRLFGNNDKKKDESNMESKQEAIDENLYVKEYQDFVFKFDDFIKKTHGLTNKSSNDISITLKYEGDESPIGYVDVLMDDINTLDLPMLYYKKPNNVETIEFNAENFVKSSDNESQSNEDWMNFKELSEESLSLYDTLSKRTPITFPILKEKCLNKASKDSIGNLPLILFWIRDPSLKILDKNTNTQSVRDIVEELTGFDISKTNRDEINKLIRRDLQDACCSPLPLEQNRPPSSSSNKLKINIEEMDELKNKYNKELKALQETHQLQINELNLTISELEDEITQLRSIRDFHNEESSFEKPQKKRTIRFKNEETVQKIEKPVSAQKKVPRKPIKLYGKDLPEDFLERLKLFEEKSNEHHKEIVQRYFKEESKIRERQLSVQHRLNSNKLSHNENSEDVCLPAVFMPYKSTNNVFNPRAHQYFHPSGYTDLRLTQPPSVFQLPSLPTKSVSVVNLFDLSNRFHSRGDPSYLVNQYINSVIENKQSEQHTTESVNTHQNVNSIASKAYELQLNDIESNSDHSRQRVLDEVEY